MKLRFKHLPASIHLTLTKAHLQWIFMLGLSLMVSNVQSRLNGKSTKIDLIVPEHGMADPHAWVQNDTIFIICGHDKSWHGYENCPMDRWEIWSSTDLTSWNYHRSILPTQTYIGNKDNCWAGDICERNGKYYWFFSNRNINTGVMIADRIDGVYKDLLGKPLLPEGIVPVHPYDPEIYIEDGVYSICFGAGQYYMATLSEDMKSLADDPKHILIQDENGIKQFAEDKPTLLKYGDWYYLVYGYRYAMSKNLYGPYTYKGQFLDGGHGSFFEWKGQLYVFQENHDISSTFRGVSLQPVNFNEDGTVIIPEDDYMYPGPGRVWSFDISHMGWVALQGTDLTWDENDGSIGGNIYNNNALIQSVPRLFTETSVCSNLKITLKNNTSSTQLKLAMYTVDVGPKYWSTKPQPVDWNTQEWVTIPIEAQSKEFITYTIDLTEFQNINDRLQELAIQPAPDVKKGHWEIKNIELK